MTTHRIAIGAIAFLAAIVFTNAAQAMTIQECNAKYKAAQAAGTVKGMKWNDFRKAECPDAAPVRASAPAKPATAPVTTFSSPWGAPLPGSARPAY